MFLTALLTACITPLRHAIAKLVTQSAPMADYVNNGKQQEQATDNTHPVLMHGCTSRRHQQLALRRLGMQYPNQVRGPCRWQKIISTMASDKSWQRTMLNNRQKCIA
jgi:hypothetical protein